MTAPPATTLRVLRIYHSGVVGEWRARDRCMRASGARVTLVAAAAWNEGGETVHLCAGEDSFVRGVRTIGHHPNLFAYEPIGLWRALRSDRFDVIDIHEEPVSVAAAEVQALAWLAGRRAPFCLYSAQNIEKRYPIPFRWIERIALRRAAAVHTCNEAAGGILRRKGFHGLLRNLGLGVDVDRYAPAAPRTRDGGGLRVGYVGRLEARKGIHVLVDAIAAVPACSLVMIGSGPAHDDVVQQIQRLDVEARVQLDGFVGADQLPDRYAELDVLVVPSLETPSWIEQFGRVAVEGMAAGLPVIASESGSLPEVVGDTGLLVPPDDAVALAEALRRLADDPAERTRLGKLARARSERYAWPTIAREQLELYREMLASAP